MFTPLITVALLALAATPPADAEPAAGPGRSNARSVLQKTFDDLWKDTQIGSDDAYQSTFYRPKPNSIAPIDLRKLVIDWRHSRSIYGGFDYNLSIGDQRLTCSWRISFHSAWLAEQSVERCTAVLTALGYRPLKLGEGVPPARAGSGTSSDQRIRLIGDTEQIVSYGAMPTVGSSDYRSSTELTWVVRRPYRASLPTLSDVLAVAPGATKAPYLGEKFYDALADQPVVGFTVGHPSISFAQPIADKIIAALEQSGFEYDREHPKLPNGGTQKSWSRYADLTHAHVITSADGQNVRFSGQPPQRQGPPLTTKRPARHPSLSLPPDKRPFLKFEELPFADERLAQQAKRFHDLAGTIAQPQWQDELYRDRRYSADPIYVAQWRTSDVKSMDYRPAVRPYQSLAITVEGRHVDGADQLTNWGIGGTLVPLDGWAANVGYRLASRPGASLVPTLQVTVGRAHERYPFSFEPGAATISLTRRFVTASTQDDQKQHYYFQAQLAQPKFERTLSATYTAPEELRDLLLADTSALRKEATANLATGSGLSVSDMTNVSGGNPPMSRPAAARPPSDATRKVLADEIERKLAEHEKLIRENFHEMHAAIQLALPTGELLKQIAAPQ